jgi:uncharacterized phage-associated protein
MPDALTQRQRTILGVLAMADGAAFAPVQVQKLFFLLDENIAHELGGRQFSFEPYNYGPFDREVYFELKNLSRHGLVHIDTVGPSPGDRRYMLTAVGQQLGTQQAETLSAECRKYIATVVDWLRRLSFAELVGSIYKAYPHMRAKSIFTD